jgi:hypothetical protein
LFLQGNKIIINGIAKDRNGIAIKKEMNINFKKEYSSLSFSTLLSLQYENSYGFI